MGKSNWVKLCTKNPNSLFSLVQGSRETDYNLLVQTERFSVGHTLINQRSTVRIGSILSTISVGLTMPDHPFLVISAANFFPNSFLWLYGEMPPEDAKTYLNVQAEVQAIGRTARRTKHERENPSLYAGRVVVLSQSKKFCANSKILAFKSKEQYKQIKSINLEEFDKLLSKIFRTKCCLPEFKTLILHLTADQKALINPAGILLFEVKEMYRFEFFKKLTNYLTSDTYDITNYLIENIKFFKTFGTRYLKYFQNLFQII